LVGLHMFEGFPDLPLWDVERLCLDHTAPPVTGWPHTRLNTTAPSVQRHYDAFNPTTGCSAPVSRIGTRVSQGLPTRPFPLASGRQVLPFHARAWFRFTPPFSRMPSGPGFRTPPRLVPE
jgi:hypothetical protein